MLYDGASMKLYQSILEKCDLYASFCSLTTTVGSGKLKLMPTFSSTADTCYIGRVTEALWWAWPSNHLTFWLSNLHHCHANSDTTVQPQQLVTQNKEY